MATLSTRRRQLAAKIGTEGSFDTAVLANTYANVLLYEPNLEYPVSQFERKPVRATFGSLASTPGTIAAKLKFKCELKGSGTAGTAPSIGKLLQACGFSETVVADTSVTYTPISTSIPVLDFGFYEDGRLFKMHSARGNFSLTANIGEPVMIEFEFDAVPVASSGIVDASILTGITYESTLPPSFKGVTVTLLGDATPSCFTNFSLNMGNTVAPRKCAMATYGYNGFRITQRSVTGKVDPEADLIANADYFTKLFAGSTASVSVVVGATAGNIITLAGSNVQVTAVGDSERDSLSLDTLDLRFCEPENASSAEMTIAFT